MKRLFALINIAWLMAVACTYHEVQNDRSMAPLEIQMGRVCGWCGGIDSLNVTEASTYYKYFSQCDNSHKERQASTNSGKWNALINSLEWDAFTAVNVNTCNVCVDGCDTWIRIRNGNETHEIRFGDESSEIKPIKTFVDKLQEYKVIFSGS